MWNRYIEQGFERKNVALKHQLDAHYGNFHSKTILQFLFTHQSMKLWISSWLFVCLLLFISINYFKNNTILLFRLGWLYSFIRLSKIFLMDLGRFFWMISSPKFPQYIKRSSGWYTWFLRVKFWEVVLRKFKHSENSISLDTIVALMSLCLKLKSLRKIFLKTYIFIDWFNLKWHCWMILKPNYSSSLQKSASTNQSAGQA